MGRMTDKAYEKFRKSLKAKACPFCGKEPEVWNVNGVRHHIHIACRNQKCGVRPHVEGYGPETLESWNTRAEVDAKPDCQS